MTAAGTRALPVALRARLVLLMASAAGFAAFAWPLVISPRPDAAGTGHTLDAPLVFLLTLPVLVAVLLAELASGGIDAKSLALLGVLSAVNAALRPLGAGTAGIETIFFLLVLAGRVFGPGFGFVLGSTSMFASALLTAGVGPWLPFQMLAASWVGLGAGLLPRRVRGRAEIALLGLYGVVGAYAYGFLMNLSFWPFAVGADTQLSAVPGGAVLENLRRFLAFSIVTSTAGWDTGRAITTLLAILLVGPAVLVALRRAARRAAFDTPTSFAPDPPAPRAHPEDRETPASTAPAAPRTAAAHAPAAPAGDGGGGRGDPACRGGLGRRWGAGAAAAHDEERGGPEDGDDRDADRRAGQPA